MSSATAGKVRVLCVDDDEALLRTLVRALAPFDVTTAGDGEEGVRLLETQAEFAVIISDMAMPMMNGAKFLGAARDISPRSSRIMLTGQPDLDAVLSAVNEGGLFRFLRKPCPPAALVDAVNAAYEQYGLVVAEQELLESTLSGSIKMLTEVMALLNPGTPRQALAARRLAMDMARSLNIPAVWRIETAVVTSVLARVTLPPALPNEYSRWKLENVTAEVAGRCLDIAHRLLSPIPRLEPVLAVVEEASRLNAAEPGEERVGSVEARILLLIMDYDLLVETQGNSWGAMKQLRELSSRHPDTLVTTLEVSCSKPRRARALSIGIEQLRPGMVTVRPISGGTEAHEILPGGSELTQPLIERLRNYAALGGISHPIHVMSGRHPEDEPTD
jgi:CheY-like chemotaxis protein